MGFSVDALPGGLTYAKLSQVIGDAGWIVPIFEQDDGTGVSTRRKPMITSGRYMAVGLSTKLIDYQFNAASQNTSIWRCTNVTMTGAQAAGAFTITPTTTGSTGFLMSTWRNINFPGNGTVRIEIAVNFSVAPPANEVFYTGVFPFIASGATNLPSDGVYFKYTNGGLFGVVNYNGVETTSAAFTTTITPNVNYTFKMDISNGAVDFWNNSQLLGTLQAAAANGSPNCWGALPVSIQMVNTTTITGTVMLARIANMTVTQRDLATEKLWENQQALSGLNASQGSEGQTIGTTALYSNNLAAGAGAVMTNTTAALGSGLGGQFTAQPTLAVATDGILCSYQNPVGSVNVIPRTLVIKGIFIDGEVTSALTGGPVIYAYSLAYGHTAVSLATAESGSFTNNTTKAPRRIPLGLDTYVALTVGTQGTPANCVFQVPIVVNPGEFVAIVAKNLGTVTTAGTITWLVRFDAFWE